MTYAISIFAATYGVTKFFRLSYSRHCDKIQKFEGKNRNDGVNLVTFGLTFVITAMYIIIKGIALAMFMLLSSNEMLENTILWLQFCVVPSMVFTVCVVFGRMFYKADIRYFTGCAVYKNYFVKILLKEPPLIAAPLLTPFVYTPKAIDRCTQIQRNAHGASVGTFSKLIYFEIDYHLSYVNNLLTVGCIAIGLVWKSEQKPKDILLCCLTFVTIMTFLLYFVKKCDDGSSLLCFEHGKLKSNCIKCIEEYGLCIKNYKIRAACIYHEAPHPCLECINRNNFKLVITGDMSVGKTSLLTVFSEQYFPRASMALNWLCIRQVFVKVDEKPIELNLWDTYGDENNDVARSLGYRDTDIVIIAFNIVDKQTLQNVSKKWIKEVRLYMPNVPIILAGLQKDKRYCQVGGKYIIREGSVSADQAQKVARDQGISKYFEVSALNDEFAVKKLFDEACRLAMLPKQGAKTKVICNIL